MVLAEDIVSVTDFARGTKEHLAEMARTQRPRVLTQNGKAAAVVVPVEMYDQLAHEAYERKMDEELKASLEAYARGERGTPALQAMQEIRQRALSRRSSR